MSQAQCECGHSGYDHRGATAANGGSGECLNCWCTSFVRVKAPAVESTSLSDYSSLGSNASVLDWILERIQRKACPQGLSVLAEELQWMGQPTMTHERLLNAVCAELRKPHPRIILVSEGIYWLRDKTIPAGWSLFGDKRMLPCFYREYPPAISWEELDRPENILPRPIRRTAS